MDQNTGILAALSTAMPTLLLQFGIALAVLALGIVSYMRITPYNDLALIRSGNRAAGTALAGVVIALALPLQAIISNHQATLDVLVWGLVAMILQVLIIFIALKAVRDLRAMIEGDNISAALALSSVQIAIAMINAGLMTGG